MDDLSDTTSCLTDELANWDELIAGEKLTGGGDMMDG